MFAKITKNITLVIAVFVIGVVAADKVKPMFDELLTKMNLKKS